MSGDDIRRLVVVHGQPDPVLESTLRYLSLTPIHTTSNFAVWAPVLPDVEGQYGGDTVIWDG